MSWSPPLIVGGGDFVGDANRQGVESTGLSSSLLSGKPTISFMGVIVLLRLLGGSMPDLKEGKLYDTSDLELPLVRALVNAPLDANGEKFCLWYSLSEPNALVT
jgi:hypothetical protein